jgi:hypothetical protein
MRTSLSNCSVQFFSTKDSASSTSRNHDALAPGVEQGFSSRHPEDVTVIDAIDATY